MYIILFGIMRVFVRIRIGEDLLLECIQQTEIWRGKCNGVEMYFLRRNFTKMEGRMNGKDYSRLI